MRKRTGWAILAALAWAGTGAPAFAAEGKARPLQLVSGYPLTGVEKARSVALAVEFEDAKVGEATLVLDPNTKSFNAFGDLRETTTLALRTYKVKLIPLKVADSKKLGRKLYALTGARLPGSFTLVMPGKDGGGYRLLHARKGDKAPTAVIVLQPVPPGGKKK
jgi:hypothetical protein